MIIIELFDSDNLKYNLFDYSLAVFFYSILSIAQSHSYNSIVLNPFADITILLQQK